MSSIFDFLPDSLLREGQTILRGLLEAIATGDTFVIDQLSQARRQLFLTTAESNFLTNLANRYNFSVAQNSGLDQNSFRQLALPAIFAPKQSIPTFNKIIEIFYGTAVLHPTIISTISEPFNLSNNDTLIIQTESGIYTILFSANKFADITNISASQIASAINAQVPELYADIVTDKNTRRSSVRIVSREFGISAKIRVLGGSVQNKLKFQGYKDSCNLIGTEWNISHYKDAVYSNSIRFTWTGTGSNPNLAIANIGDHVSIYGLQDSSSIQFSKLNGTFEIIDCGYDYFEIKTFDFPFTNVNFTQSNVFNFAITAKEYRTLFNNDQYAYVTEARTGSIDINIPVIPPIIRKKQEGVARFRSQVVELLDIDSNKLIIPYPNSFPDSGVVAFESAKFMNGFIEKYYYYSSKNNPSGNTQELLVNNAIQNSTPFLSPEECGIAFESVQMENPIGAVLDTPELIVHTPKLRHNLENIEEVVFQNTNLDQPIFKHKTVKNIRIPPFADEVSFENGMDTKLLYMQFADEITQEKYYFNYIPDPTDEDNSTILQCIPSPDERFVRAVMCSMNPAVTPGDVTRSIGPSTFPNTDTTTTYTHNFNTMFTSFMMADADSYMNIHGVRVIDNANTVKFTSAPHQTLSNVNAYVLDYQHVFPNFVRIVSLNFPLPASPSGENTVTVIHNLFSANIITEIRIRPPANSMGLPQYSIFEGPRIFFKDTGGIQSDTQFQLSYMNTTETIYVDIFLMASYFNPVESVNGKLLRADIDAPHKIKRTLDKEKFIIEILGTGPAPYGSGTITTIGKNVYGVGTQFLTQVKPNDLLILASGQNREVKSIISNTRIRLTSGFNPSISTPSVYKVATPTANDGPLGVPIKYDGAWIFGFNAIFKPDETRKTDIAFEFPDRISRSYANFAEGSIVKLLDFGYIPTSRLGLATYLKTIYLQVHSQEGKYVYFKSNIGIPLDYNPLDPNTWVIIRDGKCRRSGEFGGKEFRYYMQKPLSEWNRETFFKNAKLYLVSASVPENNYIVGSYLYDPVGTYSPYVISNKYCKLVQPVVAFESPGVLLIDNIDSLPQSGYFIINYGNSNQEGPIKYDLAIPGSPSQLKIDPAYILKKSHSVDSFIRIISKTSAPTIGIAGKEYPVYITGATQVRVTLQQTLQTLVSVGVKLNIKVQLPDLKYEDSGIAPFQE